MRITRGWYRMRKYPRLNLPDMHWVYVKGVYEYGNGDRIVSYSYNWPFPIREEMLLSEFEGYIAIPFAEYR